MKTALRAFGIGLFIAGASMAIVEHFSSPADQSERAAYEQQLQEYEAQIAALTEQADLLKEETHPEEPLIEKQPAPSSEGKNSGTDIVEATLYIYENVSIYTIGQQAEDLGIVANGRELELYLSKPEYARSIQKGAFNLRSNMTLEEIAKTLTGKKID